MALVQFGSLKIFSRKPLVTLDVLSDFLFGRWKLRNCAKLEPGSLANKVVLVTGCNAGIGYALCRKLAKAQARLLICCRTIEKAKATADRLKKEYGVYSKDCFRCFGADLEDLTAVKKLAHDILELNESIDLLVLNAGVMQAAVRVMFLEFSIQNCFRRKD